MDKVTDGLASNVVSSLFLRSSSKRYTRSQSNFFVPKVSTGYFDQNTMYFPKSI